MFYLTMHSTHFYLRLYGVRTIQKGKGKEMFYLMMLSKYLFLRLYGVRTIQTAKEMERKGNVLFNDALNTFLFTVIWRTDHSERERKCFI